MKVNWLGVILILAVVIVAISAWPDARRFLRQQDLGPTSGASGYGQATVKFSDYSVTAQVPLTSALQSQGLGGRTSLADHEGMLWMFPTADEYRFWMKDMVIPLDFIWIDDGQVVDVTPDVPPPSNQSTTALPTYQPRQPVHQILEVRAGFISAHHVAIGDPVEVVQN